MLYLLWLLADLVQVLIISALLAYLLDPATRRVESYGLSRTAATTIIFCATLLLFGLGFYLLSPVAVAQLTSFDAGSILASAGEVMMES